LKKLFTSSFIKKYHPWRKFFMVAILGLAVHLIMPQITALQNSWQVVLKMIPWAVGLAFLAQIFSYLGNGYLLQKTLEIAHLKVSLFRSTLIVLGAFSVGLVAWGTVGSSAAIYHWTSDEEGNMEGATLASLLPPLFNNVLLVLLSMIGLIHLLLAHNLSKYQLIAFGAMLASLVLTGGLSLLAMRYREKFMHIVERITSQLARILRKTYDPQPARDQLNNIFSAWDAIWIGAWQPLALGAILNVTFDILTLYFLFIAAGNRINFSVLITGYGLPLLLGKMAFVIPGGVGVIESSMAALYGGLGVPAATTVVVILGYRLLEFWIPSLLGFPVAAFLQRSWRPKDE
jgi:uncharacterized protein (TIRG00374 family)